MTNWCVVNGSVADRSHKNTWSVILNRCIAPRTHVRWPHDHRAIVMNDRSVMNYGAVVMNAVSWIVKGPVGRKTREIGYSMPTATPAPISVRKVGGTLRPSAKGCNTRKGSQDCSANSSDPSRFLVGAHELLQVLPRKKGARSTALRDVSGRASCFNFHAPIIRDAKATAN
jgi:hypothetical protein